MSAIYSINFQTHASENPLLDGGNWTNSTLQIANNLCYGTGGSGVGNGSGSSALSGPTLPKDQYAQFTIGSINSVGGPTISVFIRSNSTGSNDGLFRLLINGGNNGWVLSTHSGGSLVTLVSGTSTFNPGDVFTLVAQSTSASAYQNGTLLGSGTSSTASSFTNQFLNINASTGLAVADLTAYSAGLGNPLYWSEPDCRVNPNAARVVEGTVIYDVETSSNSAVPDTDSRAGGAPVDSRVSQPTNSRTPGTFGPGE